MDTTHKIIIDSTHKAIKEVEGLEYKKIRVTLTNGTIFVADLSEFETVYCFPTPNQWNQVSIDSYGRGIIWSSKFEVHIDQVCHFADSIEQKSA